MKLSSLFSLGLALVVAASATAQDNSTTTIVEGLSNPCGVAIQPDTGAVFVSDSATGRVCRVDDGKLVEVITGSSQDVYGKGPMYDIGPLGILFLDKDTLVVGDGGYKDGDEFLRVFELPSDGKALDYEKDAKAKLGPLAGSDEIKPEGNLYGLAATKNAIYVTCNGDDTKGWVAKSEIKGSKYGELERSIATKEAVEVDAPVGITISPDGHVVIGQMGEINKPNDSLLTFYSAKTGKMIMNLETGLHDITALAYSPKNGLLYATDFAWIDTGEGGLYRLDADKSGGKQSLKATRVAHLDKPTAMAFDKDGNLYVTVIGTAKDGEDKPSGKLLKFQGF